MGGTTMIKKDYLLAKLKEIDKVELISDISDDISGDDLSEFAENNINQEARAVLGLDIYKYSDFDGKKTTTNTICFRFIA
jgi:hypothetical protein